MKKNISLFFLFFSLLFVLSYGIQKQTQLKPDTFEITVSLVLVDVMAVDKEDNAVQDLTLGDFEVFEDGKRININSLDFIDFQKPGLTIREGEQGQARTKRFFVLFDSINTVKRMLDRSKPANVIVAIGIGRMDASLATVLCRSNLIATADCAAAAVLHNFAGKTRRCLKS